MLKIRSKIWLFRLNLAMVPVFSILGMSLGSNFREADIQRTHKNDPIPPDNQNQEDYSDLTVEKDKSSKYGSTNTNNQGKIQQVGATTDTSYKKPDDIRMEKSHDIFLRDRVVRNFCKSLATFAKTGFVFSGPIRAQVVDELDQGRCGWWKSVSCDKDTTSTTLGTCGFQWISCNQTESEVVEQPNTENLKDLAEILASDLDTSPINPKTNSESNLTVVSTEQPGSPGDDNDEETELNLHLPNSAERQRSTNDTKYPNGPRPSTPIRW